MLRGKSGSPDGVKVSFYAENEHYEVPVSLADAFVAEGVAKLADGEEKAVEKAPANKAVSKAPANKAQ